MVSGWSTCRRRIGDGFRALRKRGQSETLGVALLTGVVLILVAVVGLFLFADFGANDEEQLLANIQGDVDATNITLSHEGGDTFEPEDVRVVLTGDTTAEYSLGSDFTELTGSTGRLEPGDTWRNQVSGFVLGEGRLLVIHEPSNTILLDQPYLIEPAEDGVTFFMTDWESGPDGNPTNTNETIIYEGPSWNYSIQAQFPDGSTLSVDPANASFDINDTSKLSKAGGKLEAKDNGTVTASATVDRPGVNDSDEMEITILNGKPTLTVTDVSVGPASSGSTLQSNQVGTSAADVGTANSDKIMEGDDVAIEVEVEPTADDVEVTDDVSVNIPWSNDDKEKELEDIGGSTDVSFTAQTDETENPAETGWIGSAGVYSNVTAETGEGSMTANEVKVHGRAFYNVSITDTSLSILNLDLPVLDKFNIEFGAEITVTNIGHVDGTGASVEFSGTSAGDVIELTDLNETFSPGVLTATPLTQEDAPAIEQNEQGNTATFMTDYSPSNLLSGALGDTLDITASVSGVDADNDSKDLSLDPTNYNVTISRIDPNPVAEGDSFEVEVEVNANSNADPIDTLELDTDGLDGTPTESNVPVGESRNFTVDTSAGDADTANYSIEATAFVDTPVGEKEVNDTTAEVAVNAPAQFNITGIEANPDTVDVGESFDITYNVTNTGGVTDTQFINFTVDNGTDTVYTNNGSVEVTLDPGEYDDSLSSFSYTPEDTDRLRVNATVSSADDSNTTQVDVPYNVSFTLSVPDFGVNASDSTDMYANGSLSSMSLGSSGSLGGSQLYGGGNAAAVLYAAAPDAVRTEDNETDRGGDGGDSSSDRRGLEPETIETQTRTVSADDVQAGMTFTRPAKPYQGVAYDGSPNDPLIGSEEPFTVAVSGLDRVGVELEGAGGGGGTNNGDRGFNGGAGGEIEATIDVSEFTRLEVYVGEGGNSGEPFQIGTSEGGWGYENGGKGSEAGCVGTCGGGGGGGSSAVVGIDSNGNPTWILTAGGGGGGLARSDPVIGPNKDAFGGGGGGGDGEGGEGKADNGDGEPGEINGTDGSPGGYGGDHRDKRSRSGGDGSAEYNPNYVIGSPTVDTGGGGSGGYGGTSDADNGSDGRAFVYSLPQTVDVSNTDFIEVKLEGPGGGAGGPILVGGTYEGGGDGGSVTAIVDVSDVDELQVFVGEGGEGAQQEPNQVGQSNLMTDFRPTDDGTPGGAYDGHGGFGGDEGGHGGVDDVNNLIDGDVAVKGGAGGGSTELRTGTGETLLVAGGGGGGARDRDTTIGGAVCVIGGGNCGYGGGGGAPGGFGNDSKGNKLDAESGEDTFGVDNVGGDGQRWDNSGTTGYDGGYWADSEHVRVLSGTVGGGGDGGARENCGATCPTPGEKGEDGKIEILQTYSTPPQDGQIDLSSTNKEYLELEVSGSGGGGGLDFAGGDGGRLKVRLNVTELRNTFGDTLYYWNGTGGTYEGTSGGNGGVGLLRGGDGGLKSGGGGGSTEVRGEPDLNGALVAAADAGGGGSDGTGSITSAGGGGAAGGLAGGTSAEDAYQRPGADSTGGDGGSAGSSGDDGGYVINQSADYVETVLVKQSGGANNGGGTESDGGDGSVVYDFVNGSGAELSDLGIAGQGTNASIIVNNNTDVSVNVTNNGGVSSDFTVTLNVSNDAAIPVQRVKTTPSIAPEETETVRFLGVTGSLDPDKYDVNVSTSTDSLSGALEVTVDPAKFNLTLTDVPNKIEEGANLTIEYRIGSSANYDATADEVHLNITGLGDENPVATVSNVTVLANDDTTGTITFTDTQTIRSLAAAGLVTIAESDADNTTETRPPVAVP